MLVRETGGRQLLDCKQVHCVRLPALRTVCKPNHPHHPPAHVLTLHVAHLPLCRSGLRQLTCSNTASYTACNTHCTAAAMQLGAG